MRCARLGIGRLRLRSFDWLHTADPPPAARAATVFRRTLRAVLWASAHPWAVPAAAVASYGLARRRNRSARASRKARAQDRPYRDLVTSLPTWAVWVLSFGSPLLTFAGVVIGQAITRRGAREQELRSKREEVMRILRWAAELAVSDEQGHARLGVAQLGALLASDLLDEEEKDFVQAALTAVVREPVQRIERLGEDVQVVAQSDLPGEEAAGIPSEAGAGEERGDR